MTALRQRIRVVVAILTVLAVLAGIGGFVLFNRPHTDPLTHADAIVVLGGEWDNRVAYGLDLAREGYAGTVLLSDSYIGHRPDMAAACATQIAGVRVICFRPDPDTTRGEAMYTGALAHAQHWSKVIVVSWNYHMVRARYIFGKCVGGSLVMRPVPRSYRNLGPIKWAWIYAYQYAALAKASALGC